MLGDLGAALIVFAVTHVVTVVCLAWRPHAGPAFAVVTALCGAGAGCAVDVWLVPGHVAAAVGAAELAVVTAGLYGFTSRWLHPVGAAAWSSWLLLGAALLGWGVLFLAHLDVSPVTSWLLWAASALSAVTLPSAVVQTREGWEPLLGRGRRRAGRRPVARAGSYAPRVSVHVPCHAEPPQVVIGTLDCLAALDYPDFEVLVIDNNTADPGLWLPVATISDRKWPAVARCLDEMLTAGSANIRFATTAPPMHPATCTGRYAAASRQDSPPNAASTNDTTGLK